MLAGSVSVTTNSPDVVLEVECIKIRSARPSVTPNRVADMASRPQNTSNVVGVPGAEGFGITRPDGWTLALDTGLALDTVLGLDTGPALNTGLASAAGGTVAASMETPIPAAMTAALTKRIDSPR